MTATFDILTAFGALNDATRLRIINLTRHTQLTLSELCEILEQSQPRLSRHLKVLREAGMVDRHQEGHNVFFSCERNLPSVSVLQDLVTQREHRREEYEGDEQRLQQVLKVRGRRSADIERDLREKWERAKFQFSTDDETFQLVREQLQKREGDTWLLDVGCGTGGLLVAVRDLVHQGVGVDVSKDMLAVARAKLDSEEASNCVVRIGDMYGLPGVDHSFDVTCLHQVLHFAKHPFMAIAEAARLVKQDGVLVVADLLPHNESILSDEFGHVWQGFEPEEIAGWARRLGLQLRESHQIDGARVRSFVQFFEPTEGFVAVAAAS